MNTRTIFEKFIVRRKQTLRYELENYKIDGNIEKVNECRVRLRELHNFQGFIYSLYFEGVFKRHSEKYVNDCIEMNNMGIEDLTPHYYD